MNEILNESLKTRIESLRKKKEEDKVSLSTQIDRVEEQIDELKIKLKDETREYFKDKIKDDLREKRHELSELIEKKTKNLNRIRSIIRRLINKIK